jgi:deoxycytidylate deaminase
MKTLQERPDPLGRSSNATLVFAISGRIGSGVSFVTNGLIEELKAFGYTPIKIKITKEFLSGENEFPCTELNKCKSRMGDTDLSRAAERILKLQCLGNQIREESGSNILAAKSIKYIYEHLHKNEAFEGENARFAYIIDSLKHPDEIDLLRTVFQDALCIIGVVADDSVRKQRLLNQKHINDLEFESISKIDADEDNKYGQHTTNAILDSDYFFENNYDTPEKINQECKRLLNLLFQSSITTPRQDEYGMHLAFIAADKSACLSRQVGSAILLDDGTVLATGCNDVPRFGGGLYTSESGSDKRCFANSLICHNDYEKELMADQIISVLRTEEIEGINEEQYKKIRTTLLQKTRLKQLIEFSRAVHAEMDAIITVARAAKYGLVGSTMYVTTYPCHNCAKHIIDSGIKRVVFVEPYVKSLAQKLHSDAINNPLEEPSLSKVSFDNYGGVSPRRYSFLFSMHGDRKRDSKLIRKSLEKNKSLPLGAQETETLIVHLDQFKNCFKQLWSGDSSPVGVITEAENT